MITKESLIMKFSKRFRKHISLVVASMFLVTMTGVSNIAAAVFAPSPVLKVNLGANDILLSTENGRVLENFKGNSSNTVICIQDLHCHKEVQDNIADIMKALKETYKGDFNNVFVEGSWQKLDLDLVKAMPEKYGVKSRMIDELISMGYMTGAEKYAANELRTQVYGIENKEIYKKDSQLLADSLNDRERALRVINLFKQKLDQLKDRKFTKQQKVFSDKIKGYESQKTNVINYVKILQKYSKELGINFEAEAPNLAKILLLLNYRLQLGELAKVKQEAKSLENLISKNLGSIERQKLNELKRENNTRYYLYLKKIVDQNNVSLRDFEFLKIYFKYLEVSAAINTNLLVDEERRLKDKIYGFLIMTEEQKDLVNFEKVLNFYENFINNSVTSREALDFMASEKEYADFMANFLNQNSAYLIWAFSVKGQMDTLNKAMNRMKEFYRYAEERNNVLVLNTLGKKEKISVMVLGGYHTDGVTQLLRAKNVSYVLISPNVSQDYNTKVYENRLRQQVGALGASQNSQKLANDMLALVSFYQSSGLDEKGLSERITSILGEEEAKVKLAGRNDRAALESLLLEIIKEKLKEAQLTKEQAKIYIDEMAKVLKEISSNFELEISGEDVKVKGEIKFTLADISVTDEEKAAGAQAQAAASASSGSGASGRSGQGDQDMPQAKPGQSSLEKAIEEAKAAFKAANEALEKQVQTVQGTRSLRYIIDGYTQTGPVKGPGLSSQSNVVGLAGITAGTDFKKTCITQLEYDGIVRILENIVNGKFAAGDEKKLIDNLDEQLAILKNKQKTLEKAFTAKYGDQAGSRTDEKAAIELEKAVVEAIEKALEAAEKFLQIPASGSGQSGQQDKSFEEQVLAAYGIYVDPNDEQRSDMIEALVKSLKEQEEAVLGQPASAPKASLGSANELRELINSRQAGNFDQNNLTPLQIYQTGAHYYFNNNAERFVVGNCGLYALGRAILAQAGKNTNDRVLFDSQLINEMRNVAAVLVGEDRYLSVKGNGYLEQQALKRLAQILGYNLTIINKGESSNISPKLAKRIAEIGVATADDVKSTKNQSMDEFYSHRQTQMTNNIRTRIVGGIQNATYSSIVAAVNNTASSSSSSSSSHIPAVTALAGQVTTTEIDLDGKTLEEIENAVGKSDRDATLKFKGQVIDEKIIEFIKSKIKDAKANGKAVIYQGKVNPEIDESGDIKQTSLGQAFVDAALVAMSQIQNLVLGRFFLVGNIANDLDLRLYPYSEVLDNVRATFDSVEKRTDTAGLLSIISKPENVAKLPNAITPEALIAKISDVNMEDKDINLEVIDSDYIDTGIYKDGNTWKITTRHLAILKMMSPQLRDAYLEYIKLHETLEASLIALGLKPQAAHDKTVEILGKAEHQKWERILVLYNRLVALRNANMGVNYEAIAALETELMKYSDPNSVSEINELYDAQRNLALGAELLDAQIYEQEIIIEVTPQTTLQAIENQFNGQWQGKTVVLRGDIRDFEAKIGELQRLSSLAKQQGGRLMCVPGQAMQVIIKDNIANPVLQQLIVGKVISISAYLSMSNSIVMAPGTAVDQELYDLAKGVYGAQWVDSNAAKAINVLLHLCWRINLGLAQGIDQAILIKLTEEVKASLVLKLTCHAIAAADRENLKTVPLKQFIIAGPEVGQQAWKQVVDNTQEEAMKLKSLAQGVIVNMMSQDGAKVDVKEAATVAEAVQAQPVLQTNPPVILSLEDITMANTVVLEAAHAAGLLQAGMLAQLGPIVRGMLIPFIAKIRKEKGLAVNEAFEQQDAQQLKILMSAV